MIALAALLLIPCGAARAGGAVPGTVPSSLPPGSLASAPTPLVRPAVQPSSYGICSMTANTASINCTPVALTAGDTFVAVVYDYLTQDPNVSSSSFPGTSIDWFMNLTYTAGVPGVSSAPSLFAMATNVTGTSATGWVDVGIGVSGYLIVEWWDFPSAVAPIPRLEGSGSQGYGNSISDGLNGYGGGSTLITTFGSTRPTGSSVVYGSWNATGNPSNPPGQSTAGLNSFTSWAWVPGTFSVPAPTVTTQYSVDWTALSFTISAIVPGSLPSAPTSLALTGATRSSLSFSWSNPSGTLTGDQLWYSEGACPQSGTLRSDSLPVTTRGTVTGLPASSLFCFAVAASNANGSSPFSATVNAATPPVYGYDEKSYALPGFDPMTGYFLSGAVSTQVPTLASGPGQPFGVYYVDTRSDFVELSLTTGSVRTIAPVVPLYQRFGYGSPLGGMLDNEFFLGPTYDQALFFGTTSPTATTYSLELVNITSGLVRMWNTTASVDAYNQQPVYVGNNTVLVISSTCAIVAYNLASRDTWTAGTLGTQFGPGSTCFEANNLYWLDSRSELINVEAHGDSGDHVEQLDASYTPTGEILFTTVSTVVVDAGVVFNWVNGLAYNASAGRIAFSAGYWVAGTVYTYVLGFTSAGLLTASGEVRYSVDQGGTPTGRLLEIQRYTFTSDYVLGQSSGPAAWTNGTQLLFDPWNGSVLTTNRTLDDSRCGNSCFEGEYATTPDYLIDFNATIGLNNPMLRIVYAYHTALTPPPIYPVTFHEQGLASGTNWSVTVVGTGAFAGTVSNSSTTASIVFTVPEGFTGTFQVAPVAGYGITPASGTLDVPSPGVARSVAIAFVSTAPPSFPLYFNETGLPAGTNWSVTVNGTAAASLGPSIELLLPNGSYTFAVAPIDVIIVEFVAAPASGTVTVHGGPAARTVAFTTYYSVAFVESGLPDGTNWTVTLQGVAQSSTLPVLGFFEPNGSYPFDVPEAAGLTSTPASGRLTVAGAPLDQILTFAAPSSSGSSSGFLGLPGATGYLLVGGVAAAVVAVAVAVVFWRRSRRTPPPSPPEPEPE
jgi:Fibronectin type III domain